MTSSKSQPQTPNEASRRVFGQTNYAEVLRVGSILRKETVGGILLVVAAAIAIIWANSPAQESYFALRDTKIGFDAFNLNLSMGKWAADALLAIFFFLVGLELKRELIVGDLKRFNTAIVPVMGAIGGVIVPAGFFVILNITNDGALRGWAIPTATDIAFAVAVLAIIGSHLPPALRIFLLTLAVVDDLIAIAIIAMFYTSDINFGALALSLIPFALYGFLAHRFRKFFERNKPSAWLILLPIGMIAWVFVHEAGIHATIAGVVLGFLVPVRPAKNEAPKSDHDGGLAEEFEHRFRPLSAGFAVPVFAFFSAGVTIGGVDGFVEALTNPLGFGIVVALVIGKPIGIVLLTWMATRFSKAKLDDSLKWIDLIGVGLLAGIGFTVSLLISELSFGSSGEFNDISKVAILSASVLASLLASLVLVSRNRRYKALERDIMVDEDGDGVPDVYQR
jgi:NhaA family Na+:H+ antiporter